MAVQALDERCAESTSFVVAHEKELVEKSTRAQATTTCHLCALLSGAARRGAKVRMGGGQRDEVYVRADAMETLRLWSVLGKKHQLCCRVRGQQQASEHESARARESVRARGRAKAQHAFSASLLGGVPQGRGAEIGNERERRNGGAKREEPRPWKAPASRQGVGYTHRWLIDKTAIYFCFCLI